MVCGVDISKNSFNFCFIDNNLNKIKEGKFSLVRDDLNKFIQIVNEFDDITVIVESTGIYHINFVSFLIENNINVTANFGKLMEQKVLHLLNITNKTVNKKEQK